MDFNIHKKLLAFKINAFESVIVNCPVLRRKSLTSADISLTYSPKISDLTKRDLFKICLSENDGNLR